MAKIDSFIYEFKLHFAFVQLKLLLIEGFSCDSASGGLAVIGRDQVAKGESLAVYPTSSLSPAIGSKLKRIRQATG